MEYIKVRPYVAKRLGVFAARYRYADGNVQLWDKDLREIDRGWAFRRAEVVAAIGGLAMDPYRNREEQRKTAEECTPLPIPADPAWMPMDGEEPIVGEDAAADIVAVETAEDTVVESVDDIGAAEEGGEA